MKNAHQLLDAPSLRHSFSDRKFISKADLRHFYISQNQQLTEQAFRRILYALEKMAIIQPIDAGVYIFTNQANTFLKKEFVPSFSSDVLSLNEVIQTKFPYSETILWETRILSEFMTQQPGQNQIILEIEKDVAESVFDFLSVIYPGKIFLNPDREIIERYALRIPETILISHMRTQSPHKTINGMTYPKIEKILVDLFADEDQFFIFQGQELVRIYENVFAAYWISEKTLFRYAGRRKVNEKLREFISKETSIALIQNGVNIT